MFIGHYSAALAAAARPDAPRLGTLFVAAQLVDIGYFSLVLAGIEGLRIKPGITVMNALDLYHMPYTHSLVATLIWAAGFACLLRLTGARWRSAAIGGAVVLSHWPLDLLVHTTDLTIAGAPPKLGLGLWNHPLFAIPLELGITAAALCLYIWSTKAKKLSADLILLIAFLIAIQAYNWLSPQPQHYDNAIPVSALLAYAAAVGLAMWVARNPNLYRGSRL
jgi:hypothetical protein